MEGGCSYDSSCDELIAACGYDANDRLTNQTTTTLGLAAAAVQEVVFQYDDRALAPEVVNQTPISKLFPQVPDDAMVHVSQASAEDLAQGVWPGSWFRFGDVKHLTPTQYRGLVGTGAAGSKPAANTFVFKCQGDMQAFESWGAPWLTRCQEYRTATTVVPDVGITLSAQ